MKALISTGNWLARSTVTGLMMVYREVGSSSLPGDETTFLGTKGLVFPLML